MASTSYPWALTLPRPSYPLQRKPYVVKIGSHTPVGDTSRVTYATKVTLVIPTKNTDKKAFIEKKPELIVTQVPVKSDAGEQPYDEAGFLGVSNRIHNAYLELCQLDDLTGLVIIGAVENYIEREPSGEAHDYGFILLYNAYANRSSCVLSDGAKVPPGFLKEAAMLGFEDDARTKGKVTVGSLIAKSYPNIDPANWHKEVCGKSRYELLQNACGGLDMSKVMDDNKEP